MIRGIVVQRIIFRQRGPGSNSLVVGFYFYFHTYLYFFSQKIGNTQLTEILTKTDKNELRYHQKCYDYYMHPTTVQKALQGKTSTSSTTHTHILHTQF